MLDIIKYLNKIKSELEEDNLSFTEIYIAYKIETYGKNNDIKLTNELLLTYMEEIYDLIISNDDNDIYDQVIEEYFE